MPLLCILHRSCKVYPSLSMRILLLFIIFVGTVTARSSSSSRNTSVWSNEDEFSTSNVVLVQPNKDIHLDYIHRIDQVINLLRLTHQDSTRTTAVTTQSDDISNTSTPWTSSSSTLSNETPQRQKYKEAIRILQSLRIDLMQQPQSQVSQPSPSPRRQQQQQSRRRMEEAKYDEDDYFNYYNVYRQRTSSDVEITFDEEDNTVVTVGDDVIVLVDHEYTFYVYNVSMIVLCIVVGATMAGLLMGVMSLDPLIVSVKARTAATSFERQQALTLLPFVQNKNLVLVSLLLVNCGTNEALPVFLDNLLENPFITVLLSLTVVLVVGEILPSAYFTGRDQVTSASKLVPVLRFVIIITSPISYPLAKLMDHYFHPSAEVSAMKRGEVTAMVRIQYEEHLAWKRRHAEDAANNKAMDIQRSDTTFSSVHTHLKRCDSGTFCTPCEPLSILRNTELYACINPYQPGNCTGMVISNVPSFSNPQQQDLGDDDIIKLEGALSMKDKKVNCAYTPMHRVVSILADTILDENMVVQIYSYGYSRIPVVQQYLDERNNPVHGIVGIVLTKQLMLIGKEDRRRVSSLTMYEPPCVSPRASLAEALNIILTGKRKASNMALVCTDPVIATKALQNMQPIPIEAGVLGIITLENILEELIQEPIFDEKDKKMNPKLERAKWALGKWKAFVLRKRIQRDDEYGNNNDVGLNINNPFDYVKMKEIV